MERIAAVLPGLRCRTTELARTSELDGPFYRAFIGLHLAMDQRQGRNSMIRRERACVTELVCRPANLARLVERVHPESAETFAPTTPADLIGSGWLVPPSIELNRRMPVHIQWLMAGHELPGGLASYHRPVAVDVETSIEIECPRSVVAAFVSNPENAPQWYVNIKSITWETTPPAVLGSRIAFVAQFLGRRIAYTYEVREIAPGERFVMSTAQGPFPMQTTYSWQDTESGGTRMTLRNSGEPSGFGRMAAPMMAAAMRKANQRDLARLKTILENKS